MNGEISPKGSGNVLQYGALGILFASIMGNGYLALEFLRSLKEVSLSAREQHAQTLKELINALERISNCPN